MVRLYQLKDATALEQAEFSELWDKPKEVLGEDLFREQEITLFPGRHEELEVPLDPAVRYLAGVALYRQPTGTLWRSIVALPASSRLCSAYAEGGAPAPAVVYRFDQYRVESRSRLLGGDADQTLPQDVAPSARSKENPR